MASEWVLQRTGAQAVSHSTVLQPLWGGHGELLRLRLEGAAPVILKKVVPPQSDSFSEQRKRRSYMVEQEFYRSYASRCGESSRVARLLGALAETDLWLLLLEDLQESGFQRCRSLREPEIAAGLRWLAHFHAAYLGVVAPGLWEQGSYWHLETRPEEWRGMAESPWKRLAHPLDAALRGVRNFTVIHGDAKPANFLWHRDGTAAAVDFQYVGGGAGIRDVAYFLDCCLDESGCDEQAEEWLDFYFGELRAAGAPGEVEQEWRPLFPVAWSDFWRFYLGWSRGVQPGRYTRRQLEKAEQYLSGVGKFGGSGGRGV